MKVRVKWSGNGEARVASRGSFVKHPATHFVGEWDETKAEVTWIVCGALHEFFLRRHGVHRRRRGRVGFALVAYQPIFVKPSEPRQSVGALGLVPASQPRPVGPWVG